jgi:hypothetical protein
MATVVNMKLRSGIDVAGQIVSTLAQGTAPLVIASTTKVDNLNVSLLNGYSTDTGTTASTIPVRNGSGLVVGDITGNAATATVLATARTINGVSFNGSANISFNSDAVAEGSTNLYYTNARARAAISVTGTGLSYDNGTGVISLSGLVSSVAGRSGDVTLSVSDVSGAAPLASPTFTGTVTSTNDLVINGNLTVNGTTTTINSTTVSVDDVIFNLAGDTAPTVDDGLDKGISFQWYSGSAKVGYFGFDRSTGYFTFIPDATINTNVVSGTLGTLDVAAITGNAATATKLLTARTINGVSFDGTANISFNSDSVSEGSTNLYFTNTRARGAVSSGSTGLSYNSGTGVFTLDADLDAIGALAGTSGLLKKTDTNTWTLDTATYLTANQSITLSGDVTGTGTTAITTTLANSGVSAGTYSKVTVNAKGLVTVGANIASSDVTTALGYTPVSTAVLSTTNSFITDASITTTSTTPTAALSLTSATYRAVDYVIQAVSGSNYTITKLLVVHDGTNVSLTEYGTVSIGSSVGSFDADINSGNLRLLFTAASASSTTVKVVATAILV